MATRWVEPDSTFPCLKCMGTPGFGCLMCMGTPGFGSSPEVLYILIKGKNVS